MGRLLRNIFMFVVYAYLYIPIAILVTNSFNDDRYGLTWKGFSWKWYERLFSNDTFKQPFTLLPLLSLQRQQQRLLVD